VQRLGDRANEQRLGQPRHAHDEAVAPYEERDHHLLDHRVLAHDELAKLAVHAIPPLLQAIGQRDVVRGC
jgi:hypothetical protein